VFSIKFSFILGYFSLSPYLPRRFFWVLWFITIYTVLGALMAPTLVTLLWCRPVSDNWNNPDRCTFMTVKSLYLHATMEHIISDVMVIGFGLVTVGQLSCPRKEVLGAIVIASLGMVSVSISIVRAVLVWAEHFTDEMLFCSVEVSSGVIAACLPAFRAYLRSAWSPEKRGSPEMGSPSGITRGTPGYLSPVDADELELESVGADESEFSAVVVREDINVELHQQKILQYS
jgi:hypothetical protein